MNNLDVIVSVYCLAYNHEKYIKNTLEGFINQKTTFKYEVFVHDDASTDNTPMIIKEYAKKYPNIIKPILQTENKYSQGIDIRNQIIAPLVTGKYIAVCEGDDYWCDSNKLQKQVDFLDSNLEYSACVHNTRMYNVKKNKYSIMFEKKEKDLELEDVIYRGGQSYHTSSLMYRAEYFETRTAYMECMKRIGDYPMSIFLISKGKVHFFPDIMSLYRYGVPGSWSAKQEKQKIIETYYRSIQMLQLAKNDFRDTDLKKFDNAIKRYEYEIKKAEGDYSILKDERYQTFYKNESLKNKIKIQIKRLMCVVYK